MGQLRGLTGVAISRRPMVCFRARAEDDSISVDGEEILEARWFTKAELAERAASGRPLGRPDSIDRHLLQSWLVEQEPGQPG